MVIEENCLNKTLILTQEAANLKKCANNRNITKYSKTSKKQNIYMQQPKVH